MNIKIGNYTLTSDPCNILVNTTRTAKKDGKTRKMGDKYLYHEAYFGCMEHAANWLVDEGIYGSEADSLDALTADIGRLRKELTVRLEEAS